MCIVICDCEIFWLAAGSCDWGHQAWGLFVEWDGGMDGHMRLGGIFELGEVNAHGMCVSATNK